MESHLLFDVDNQIMCLKQALTAANNLKTQCLLLEKEKKAADEKCAKLDEELQRLKNRSCPNCVILTSKLKGEVKRREAFQKAEREKLLKSIEKALQNVDDANTNQMTNAHQLFTQLVDDGLVDRPDVNEVGESDEQEEDKSTIIVNETIVGSESEGSRESNGKGRAPLVVPETQPIAATSPRPQRNRSQLKSTKNQIISHGTSSRFRAHQSVNVPKENRISPKEETGLQQINKKFKYSPDLSKNGMKSKCPSNKNLTSKPTNDVDKTLVLDQSDRSPSVLSEIIEEMGGSSSRSNKSQEEKGSTWKMRPSVLVESNTPAGNGRKMKQMTLSVARPEKKHDISLSEVFNGGVAKTLRKLSDEDKDVILPSPENLRRKTFQKKPEQETMEDPDMTVFHPAITSTCLPLESSFHRLPDPDKSPPYKYKRETVRRRVDRLKLPGQECDECAKYYQAAGLDKTQDLQHRMNACSRHRDKYQIRAHTPPGFWDPVMPPSPDD